MVSGASLTEWHGAPVRTLIVEDEPLARRALRSIVDGIDWLECVGEAVDAEHAADAIRSLDPELIFLDVQLPGGNGITVVQQAATDAAVILTTAFDTYALAAYELGAIDYVTKPFGADRVLRAVHRAGAQVRAHREQRAAEAHVAPSRPDIGTRMAAIASTPIDTMYVRDRGAIIPVRSSEIIRCEADGDYVAVYAGGRRYLVYITLSDLNAQLDTATFLRVHRSHVVNLSAIASIHAIDRERLQLRLRDGSRVAASRTGSRALRARLRGSHGAS